MEMQITFPEFLTIAMLVILVEVGIYLLHKTWTKRLVKQIKNFRYTLFQVYPGSWWGHDWDYWSRTLETFELK